MDLRSPSSEYRPAPFWSWNDTLTDEELRWQVRELKRAGYGGFFMHPRVGLETEYLSGADYLLISDERMAISRARVSADRYYRALFEGRLGFEMVQAYRMHPAFLGLVFDHSRADLNIRRYDHPATYVFRRSGDATLFAERPDLEVYALRSWKDCLTVFRRSLRLGDFILFKRCLPRDLRASLSEPSLMEFFDQVLSQPEAVRLMNQPGSCVEEKGVWRLDLSVEPL